MSDFRNTKEMESIFSQIAKEAVANITRELKFDLQDEIDEQGIGLDGEFYQGTGEFYDAWEDDIPTKISSSEYEGVMQYNPDMIKTKQPEDFIHGSNYWDTDDVSEILPNIIFNGKSGDFFGHGFWSEPRDAWTPTIKRMEKKFPKLMKDSFAKNGIKIKRTLL